MRILICLLFSIVAVDFVAAGCKIDVGIKNETKYAIIPKDRGSMQETLHVKTRAVPWRNAWRGSWYYSEAAPTSVKSNSQDTGPGTPAFGPAQSGYESGTDTYDAVLGCGVKRRYRFDYYCREVEPHPKYSHYFLWKKGSKRSARKTRYFPGPKEWTERRNVTIPIKSCK